MKKTLVALSIFFCSYSNLFSQGAPACPTINTTGGSVCQGACVPLTATVVTNNQTTSYSVSSIPYVPYAYSGGTGVSVGTDDVWSPLVNLPFSFCYFGTAYTQCLVGSNGQITFDLTSGNINGFDAWTISTAMPNTVDMPANTICGVFRDIDPSLGGSVYYYISGASPCRALVVCYDNIPLFNTSNCGAYSNSSFQMVLYENTNYIDVYVGNSTSCSAWNSGYGIIGIQDATATTAVCAPGWNYPSTPTGVGVAFRFSPTGAPSYAVTWTDPSGVVGNGLTLNACPPSTTTYTATMVVTNCDGTQITVSDTAIVTVTPGTAVTVNSPTICAGSTATLTANGGTTYTWSANAGGGNSSTVSVSPGTTTVYTVTTNAGGGGGCAPIAQSTVTVIPALTVTVNVPAVICAGASATLTANGATNYTWTPATGLSATTGSVVVASPGATTVYTVTGSSGACPSASATTTVTIAPTITVNSPTICAGSAAILTAVGGTTYTWSANAGGATTNTVSVSPAITTVYTVTTSGGGGGGCPPVATSTVTVVPSLSVTVNIPATICSGATTTLTAGGAATYSWTPATGLSSTTGSTVTASPNTTTAYTVTGSAGTCPSAIATTTVTVTPSTTITVNSATICPTTSATLTANGSATYNWSPATGLSSTTGASVTANPLSTTVYTVSGTICVTAGTCTVTVIPACSITVNSATVCPSATATLTANGGGSYTWAPATGLSATTGASVTASPPSTTVYTVTSTSGGFTTTATATVIVSPSPTISVNNATICQGASTGLTANGASTYMWTPATGLSATTASAVVASPTVTTTYTITGTAINTCTNTAVSTIGVNPMPTVSVTPTSSSGCAPLCVSYTSLSSTSSLNYSWNFGDGGTSFSPNPTNCFTGKGTYKITLTLTDANNCKGTSISTATVYPQPQADFGASPQPISILEPTIQFTDLSTNGPIVKWNWNFGAWGSADTSHYKNPSYTYQDTGYFVVNLWVSTAFGCKDSTTKIIKIDDDYELFVPTAFTPNGDGVNEYFLPVTRGVINSNYHLYIYDRWGNLIFQTEKLEKGWDGTIHGTIVQEDVFVWKILLKTTAGTNKQVHGQVSVVK